MLDYPLKAQGPTLSPARVVALPIIAMARFRRLMLGEGWPVDLPRMCVDRHYAFECLALAHTSSDDGLRHAALELFAAYDRNSQALPHCLH